VKLLGPFVFTWSLPLSMNRRRKIKITIKKLGLAGGFS
jgi:hypothetical protein